MSTGRYRVRRALIDDLPALRELWGVMQFPVAELEKQLLEFQVAEAGEGKLAGAVAFQIDGPHACLYGEGYLDFSMADELRELFWERVQVLAANHGVFRLWRQDNSPFWTQCGFKPASPEDLARLPQGWRTSEARWFTLRLKDEDAINSVIEKEMAAFKVYEGREVSSIREKARTMNIIFSAIGVILGIVFIGLAVYLMAQHAAQNR
jgi:N-acetylglutamate synthase-like GNAT family acetyltransferase